MYIVKVRRVGNSNVITLPKELEASGYVAGTSVLIERSPNGQLRMGRCSSLSSQQWYAQAADVAAADREALDKLAAYDRGDLSEDAKNAIVRRVAAENRDALDKLAAHDHSEPVAEGDDRSGSRRRPAT
jgi:antitoxin component of MazEF toxin-antitoxin module